MAGLGGKLIHGHHARPLVAVDPRPGVSAALRVLRAGQERWRASNALEQGGDPRILEYATFSLVPDGPRPPGGW